jgi:hypothetical protein
MGKSKIDVEMIFVAKARIDRAINFFYAALDYCVVHATEHFQTALEVLKQEQIKLNTSNHIEAAGDDALHIINLLLAERNGVMVILPSTDAEFEGVCEAVHNAWWDEKKRQGVTDHPDMIPYAELAESVKDYDRATVRTVLTALKSGCSG